jgi:sulfur-oxidizing protein SoxY
MSADPAPLRAGRRSFLIQSGKLAAGAALVCLLPASPGRASPQASQELIRSIVGDASLQPGRVNLDVPPLVENGNTVPLTVSVDSPMTEADHVKAIHIVNEKNPQPHVISVTLGRQAGKAQLATRIKLADSQRITAIAEFNDGSFWSGSADVVVTLAACVEDLK